MDVEPLKNAYWAIVTDCLERFHGYDSRTALEAVRQLRQAIEFPPSGDAPPGYDSDLFYHNEPFDVACDVADTELVSGTVAREYDVLVRYRYGPAEKQLRLRGALRPWVCNAH